MHGDADSEWGDGGDAVIFPLTLNPSTLLVGTIRIQPSIQLLIRHESVCRFKMSHSETHFGGILEFLKHASFNIEDEFAFLKDKEELFFFFFFSSIHACFEYFPAMNGG